MRRFCRRHYFLTSHHYKNPYKKKVPANSPVVTGEFLGVTELKDQQWKISVSYYPEVILFILKLIDEIIYEVSNSK